MKVKICPKCKNTDLAMVAGGNIGIWKCKKCGYRGSIFPEKEVELKKKIKKQRGKEKK